MCENMVDNCFFEEFQKGWENRKLENMSVRWWWVLKNVVVTPDAINIDIFKVKITESHTVDKSNLSVRSQDSKKRDFMLNLNKLSPERECILVIYYWIPYFLTTSIAPIRCQLFNTKIIIEPSFFGLLKWSVQVHAIVLRETMIFDIGDQNVFAINKKYLKRWCL